MLLSQLEANYTAISLTKHVDSQKTGQAGDPVSILIVVVAEREGGREGTSSEAEIKTSSLNELGAQGVETSWAEVNSRSTEKSPEGLRRSGGAVTVVSALLARREADD